MREKREKVNQGLEIEKERKINIFIVLRLMSNKKGNKDKNNIHNKNGQKQIKKDNKTRHL